MHFICIFNYFILELQTCGLLLDILYIHMSVFLLYLIKFIHSFSFISKKCFDIPNFDLQQEQTKATLQGCEDTVHVHSTTCFSQNWKQMFHSCYLHEFDRWTVLCSPWLFAPNSQCSICTGVSCSYAHTNVCEECACTKTHKESFLLFKKVDFSAEVDTFPGHVVVVGAGDKASFPVSELKANLGVFRLMEYNKLIIGLWWETSESGSKNTRHSTTPWWTAYWWPC